MLDSIDVNLSTQLCQYDPPPETQLTSFIDPFSSPNGTLLFPWALVEAHPKIEKGPLCQNAPNSHVRDTHNYNILDDLA